MENKQETPEEMTGVVDETLPNTLFRVNLSNDEKIIAYLSGKMRKFKIKVLVGDKVIVAIDPYGGKGRIIKRL
ncbi:MAG: translation initiation factor IF-1 [Candidatus Pacebacteria bacterium]|jgi:translation initiation factor IF-1|nr:translation initiation factor IF-1 [Candidatus Paceibacterota bacterium]|tara:strand:+ start:66236 stop:66454 length:219 start_codon:yes stop_codon:yes gene_type:complete